MNITQMFLTPNKYSRPQIPLTKVTKIAVHYVGNAGSTATANRNYFNNLATTHSTYVSSHYIVGLEGEIIQCIPEDEIAYCTNSANAYSISIENCHPNTDGKFNTATVDSLRELCADLCTRYKLNPITDIIRHYDVTGKLCPLYWVNHPDEFEAFKKSVQALMQSKDANNNSKKVLNFTVNGKKIKAEYLTKNNDIYIKLESLKKAEIEIDFDTN